MTVFGSGTSSCDGLYCPSKVTLTKSESGTISSIGYWNGRFAWDREDGTAKMNPSISYSNSYLCWRLACLDGHLAYDITENTPLPNVTQKWNFYKKGKYGSGKSPAPKMNLYRCENEARAALSRLMDK